jgi:hypothetical protein
MAVDHPDWEGLAREIKARRDQLRLPQDLTSQGGPTALTVRKFERTEAATIRNKTKTQLERALQWPEGHVDLILGGEDSSDTRRLPSYLCPLDQPLRRYLVGFLPCRCGGHRSVRCEEDHGHVEADRTKYHPPLAQGCAAPVVRGVGDDVQ